MNERMKKMLILKSRQIGNGIYSKEMVTLILDKHMENEKKENLKGVWPEGVHKCDWTIVRGATLDDNLTPYYKKNFVQLKHLVFVEKCACERELENVVAARIHNLVQPKCKGGCSKC